MVPTGAVHDTIANNAVLGQNGCIHGNDAKSETQARS